MPAMPYWKDVLDIVRSYADEIVFITTPDKHRNSYSGKFEWMQRHGLGDYEFITCKNKWRLARPRCVLIDDFEVHIENWGGQVEHLFREHGNAILFPQPWNELHHIEDRLNYLDNRLKDTQ
jgi:5'(3')-deoxyribonucleotidase